MKDKELNVRHLSSDEFKWEPKLEKSINKAAEFVVPKIPRELCKPIPGGATWLPREAGKTTAVGNLLYNAFLQPKDDG